jgi:sarcosine oxidase subunit gamma
LHGHVAGAPGVQLSETQPGSIVQAAAWPDTQRQLIEAIAATTSLALSGAPGAGSISEARSAFGIAPGRWLLIDEAEGLAAQLAAGITSEIGTVTDLSHGRTAIRVAGPRAEWVLSKLFAVDFAFAAFPLGHGRSTMHHDVHAAIQRTALDAFDLYVFRSFARSFWTTLCHAAEEVGYEVG